MFEYDKARLHPPVPGMTEEEMFRRGPMCKDCHKEHYGQMCPCNICGWIHGCLDRPFTPEEIPTITEVPPEDSETKEINLTVPIKGKHWCWLCKSHGPEEVCPRKDEVSTEYGRQRLKELLQEMVKSEEKSKLDQEKNGKIPKVDQRVWALGTPHLVTTKEEFVGPKVIQPPEGKTPHVKPIELGLEPNGHLSQNKYPIQHTGSSGGQPPGKSARGMFYVRGRGNKNGQEKEQPPPRPPPRENGGNGGNGGGYDEEEDEDDKDDDDDETKTVSESEGGEDPNVPVGGGAPGGDGGGGDGPRPNLGVGNVGPRGKRGHRGQRGRRGWMGPQGVPGIQGSQGPRPSGTNRTTRT